MGVLDTACTPLVRTDFSSPTAWREVVDAIHRDWEDGFRAQVTILDDPAFDGWTADRLAALPRDTCPPILLVADATTMTNPERLVLCVDLLSAQKSFRVILPQLWSVENNLSLCNLDFDDFAGSLDGEGVYRGFD
jgi:hypothetical protein